MIRKIYFYEIKNIWKEYLWPERTSLIERNSAMLFLNGYDLKNFNYNPTFFGYFFRSELVGVNSGHLCIDNSYRSRGLYVFPNYRKKGIGKQLLIASIAQAKKEKAQFIWSYPRINSWSTYKSAGYTLSSDWHDDENGKNAFCRFDIT